MSKPASSVVVEVERAVGHDVHFDAVQDLDAVDARAQRSISVALNGDLQGQQLARRERALGVIGDRDVLVAELLGGEHHVLHACRGRRSTCCACGDRRGCRTVRPAQAARRAPPPRSRRALRAAPGEMNGRSEPAIYLVFVRRRARVRRRAAQEAVAKRRDRAGVARCLQQRVCRRAIRCARRGRLRRLRARSHAAARARVRSRTRRSTRSRASTAATIGELAESRRAARRCAAGGATASSDTSPMSGAKRRRLPSGSASLGGKSGAPCLAHHHRGQHMRPAQWNSRRQGSQLCM